MKKLCNNKGAKRIHPSPPPPPPSFTTTSLSFLPTALLALASSLSPQDQEVLAYLLDSPKGKEKHKKSHNPQLGCSCFGCYKSFWARWDSSPNRHVIHLIIDAFEENVELKEMGRRKGRTRKKTGVKNRDENGIVVEEKENVEKMLKINDGRHDDDGGHEDDGNDEHEDDGNDEEEVGDDDEEEEGKSSLKRQKSGYKDRR